MSKALRSAGFAALGLSCLTLGLLLTACTSSGSEEAEPQIVAEVHVAPVTLETITPSAKAVGTLEPLLGRSADIVPTAPGRVLEVKVREGDTVAKGQLLVRIETS